MQNSEELNGNYARIKFNALVFKELEEAVTNYWKNRGINFNEDIEWPKFLDGSKRNESNRGK